VGTVLASKYRLEALLGSGGMGHVYRAVNEHVGRAVAIKLLRSEHAENPVVVERFLREARAANLVRHPNVVDVIDIGQHDDGSPFIVQELLEGEDLSQLMTRRGGKLPIDEVIDLVGPVIDAVAEAHARGVVHRDIKPENVFLAKGKRGPVPKLLDFGISKVRAPDLRATEVGVMMGTPAYMAPEQVQGARDADPRSDVWALGVMLFELIAGRMPFDVRDAPALFVAIATKDAPTLLDVKAEVTPAISRIVERCLRRRPDERYPSAAELSRDLRLTLDGSEIEPTEKRSIPPGARAAALAIANKIPAAPLAPTFAKGGPDGPAPENPSEVVVSERSAAPVTDDLAPSGGTKPSAGATKAAEDKPIPEAPSLAPPPIRAKTNVAQASASAPVPVPVPVPVPGSPAPASAPASASASAPASASASASASAPAASAPPNPPRAGRLNADASLPGVMLAPPGAHVPPPTFSHKGSREAWGLRDEKPSFDASALIGLGVVGLVTILAVGGLMQVAHRPEGWPIARFALASPPPITMAVHGGLGLIAIGLGITYCRRAFKHWKGELGGGPPNAIINALVAAGSFFCAIEILSAIS